MRFLSFDEIMPNGHVTVTEDGMLYAVELAMVVASKERNQAGEILRNLDKAMFNPEKFLIKKMPGKGNGRCKLITLENAIELVMVLPGTCAKEYRQKFVDIIKRYLAGDMTLIQEIEHNAASHAPINTMAREACIEDSGEEPQGIVGYKRMHESVTMSRELVVNTETVTKFMREQNGLARERWDIDLSKMQEQNDLELKHAKAKYDLRCLEFKAELDFKREVVQILGLSQGQSGGHAHVGGHDDITLLSTFVKHSRQFSKLTRKQEDVVLREAGKKAAHEFWLKYHAWPKKITEGAYANVNSYPKSFESAIMAILQDAYRVVKNGAGQPPLRFESSGGAAATIVVSLP